MAQYDTFKVENWNLRVFQQKETDKGLTLNCSKSGKKKDDGTYEKGLSIKVFCSYDSCDYDASLGDDASGSYISVDGNFATSEYTNKDGEVSVICTIFASAVRKVVYDSSKK